MNLSKGFCGLAMGTLTTAASVPVFIVNALENNGLLFSLCVLALMMGAGYITSGLLSKGFKNILHNVGYSAPIITGVLWLY